jgi:hypothetical protein
MEPMFVRRTAKGNLMYRNFHSESSSTSECTTTVTRTKTVLPFEPSFSFFLTSVSDFVTPVRCSQHSIFCLLSFQLTAHSTLWRLIMASVDGLTAPFFNNPQYSDIIIKYGEHQIRAHKVILAQHLGYFATAFFSHFQVITSSTVSVARLTPSGCIEPYHRSG